MTDAQDAEYRLATYGTLSPGQRNAHQLASLRGEWSQGTVRARPASEGWGPSHGYPAVILDEVAGDLPVHVLTSAELPAHWARLDAFEGPGYRREVVRVATAAGAVWATIYVDNSRA